MRDFKAVMKAQQVEWKRKNLPNNAQARGWQNGGQYDHVLPKGQWELNLWPGLLAGGLAPLGDYLKRSGVQHHTGTHNLLSSWVVCANLYFPFQAQPRDLELVASFLRSRFAPEVEAVHAIELEYEFPGELSPRALLGERGGNRGSGQTSPDVAFLVRTKSGEGAILTECKFTEESFYPCSARTTKESDERPKNPDASRCYDAASVLRSPNAMCHQVKWGRRYWEHLQEVADVDRIGALTRCPAATSGYQLFRQQALAEGVAKSGKYDLVVSSVAYDARNDILSRAMKSTGIASISEWAHLFSGKAKFGTFTHQEWVSWVRKHGGSRWQSWIDYVSERYGYH